MIISAIVSSIIYIDYSRNSNQGVLFEENGLVKFQNKTLCSLEVNKNDDVLNLSPHWRSGFYKLEIRDELRKYKTKNPNNNIKLKISDTLKFSAWSGLINSAYLANIKNLKISSRNDSSTMIYFDDIVQGSKKYSEKLLRLIIWNDSMKIDTGIIGTKDYCSCATPDGDPDDSISNSKNDDIAKATIKSTISISNIRTYRYNDLSFRNKMIAKILRENIQSPFVFVQFAGEVTSRNAITTLNFIHFDLKMLKRNPVIYFSNTYWRITKDHL